MWVKRPGREADHSLPSSAEVKECVELYIHSPNTPSWRGAQLKTSTGTTCPFKVISIGTYTQPRTSKHLLKPFCESALTNSVVSYECLQLTENEFLLGELFNSEERKKSQGARSGECGTFKALVFVFQPKKKKKTGVFFGTILANNFYVQICC
jgi:hypothetical protein